jgi:predicted glycosyltransferase
MKTYLFMISHPAHFHMFKNTMTNLQKNGNKIVAVIRPKDVLEQLCVDSGLSFYKVCDRPQKNGLFGLGISLLKKIKAVLKIVKKEKPDLLIGSDGVLAYVGCLRHIPAFECNEDDAKAIKLYALMFFPFFSNIIFPKVTDAWLWKYKKIGYNSYHELGYLHPNQFTPKKEIVEKYFSTDKPYFIIRFSKLNAHHDVGIKGINAEIAQKIINILKPHGDIYITSERKLEPQFEPYGIRINPLDMHHVMAFASLYIGDSQTMAAEAGVLGVPFVRFNDFVGRLGYLRELEEDYKLGFGIKTNETERLYAVISELVAMPDRHEVFRQRRQKMLSEKIDYAQFLTWFIENYPESKQIMKENPDYQYKFR